MCVSGVSRHLLQNAVMVPNDLLATGRCSIEFEWTQCNGVAAMAAIDLQRSRQYDHKWTGGKAVGDSAGIFFGTA